ncbi:Cell wall-associated polypeptide CWBP200 [Mycobacterium tuberculosis]|nr:Cell wall-associated polypeptide CWBP200 [Mycobacterium tuberculosis]
MAPHTWQTFSYEYGTQRPETAQTSHQGVQGDDRYATYHYTDAGTITSITDVSRDGTDNQCYLYDHLQRLTQAWAQGTTDACATEPTDAVIGGPAPYWQTFTYDSAGNRTGETRHGIGGTTDTVRTYTYAPAGQGNSLTQVSQTGPTGQRTDTYAYDATGNTTKRAIDASPTNTGQTFEWDTEGELSKVTENGNDVTFVYDADGNRLLRKDPAGATLYLPDGTELRALGGASTATGTRYYTFAGQTVAMRTSDGTITHLAGDHQGTAQIAVNTTTHQTTIRRSTPFGGIRGFDDDATWPNDKGFLGATKDPTGLTHLGAREYDPDTGRFISVDPVLDTADPLQMNGYTYASNNPVTHSDPSGLRVDGCEVNHDCGCPPNNPGCKHTPKNAPKGSQRCNVYCGPTTTHFGAKAGGDRLAAHALGYALPRKVYQHLLNLGYRGSQDFSLRDAIAIMGAGLDDNQWDGFCRTVNASAQSLCHHNPFTGHDTTDFGLKQALIIGGVTTVVIAGAILCAAGGCESGAFQAAGLACARSGLCLRAVSGAMSAGGAISSSYGAGDIPSGGLGRSESWLGRLFCRSSFTPGTQVLMADGSKKSIEDLRVGDKVLATDPETGKTKPEPVLGTITSKGDKGLVQISVNSDAPALAWMGDSAGQAPKPHVGVSLVLNKAKSGVVLATNNHPFWVAGDINAWVEAADLKPGMWLRTSGGTYVQVTATKHWTTRHQRVHNLAIANTHTYYVLAGNISALVHNYGCDEWAAKFAKRNGGEIKTFVGPGGDQFPMGPYRPNGPGTPELGESWFHHTVVVKEGKVYDQWHPKGIGIDEYKTRFDYGEDIDFGF